MQRRHALLALLAPLLLSACASPPLPEPAPPTVFVHGNGDSAALWTTTVWRFESNGWPRERLHAIDLPDPGARDDEFVVSAPGYAVTHIYRSPFPRSSRIVNLRAERIAAADSAAVSVITLNRPRGYFGVPRDRIALDGVSPPPGIPPGVAGVSSAKLKLDGGAGRAVAAEFESGPIRERIAGRAWPAAQNHLVVLELTN